jgi:hypothetical protein
MDGDSYYTAFYFKMPVEWLKLGEVIVKGERKYYINVREHRWMRALCPTYMSKHFAETLDNLRAKEEALELRLKFLESQIV